MSEEIQEVEEFDWLIADGSYPFLPNIANIEWNGFTESYPERFWLMGNNSYPTFTVSGSSALNLVEALYIKRSNALIQCNAYKKINGELIKCNIYQKIYESGTETWNGFTELYPKRFWLISNSYPYFRY